jgi:hypothetical protein
VTATLVPDTDAATLDDGDPEQVPAPVPCRLDGRLSTGDPTAP